MGAHCLALIGPRRRSIWLFAFVIAAVALSGCGGHNNASPEPRVIISPPSASASPLRTPTAASQAPPTGGAPTPSSTAFVPPTAASTSAATCTANGSSCAGASPTSAAASGSGTPVSGVPSAVPSAVAPLAPAGDPTLQAALARALLREGDLPSGYVASYLGQTDATLAHQTAGYGGFFANGDPTNPGPGGFQVFIAALAGFTDPASAAAQAGDVRGSAISSLGQGVVLTPLPAQPSVAGAQLYSVDAPKNGGGQLTGFVIAWQHGRVLVVLAQLGLPPPVSLDIINAIAKRQDDKLRAAGL
jgi:hypothetical protein